jgi:alpha-galactosidase
LKATQDRREALKDADFVINMVQIGGFDSTLVDFEIPRKYGLNFTIADTTGPGWPLPRAANVPHAQGPGRGYDGGLPEGDPPQLLQPDEHEHADDHALVKHRGGRTSATASRAP